MLVVISMSVLGFTASCGQTVTPTGNEQAQAGSQSTPPANESPVQESTDGGSNEKAENKSETSETKEDPSAKASNSSPQAVKPGTTPRFEDYPAKEIFTGKTAPLKLNEDTRMFRTRLSQAAKGPPNFAGRYILVTWGCGTDCLMGGVIDAKTGDTTMIPFSICCQDIDAQEDMEKVDVRKDSRLAIFNGLLNEEESEVKTHYYLFENGKFTPLSMN